MSDIVTKIDLADKNGVLLHTEKKYCRRNLLVIPRLNPLEISENGTYPVPNGFAGNGAVVVNVVPKKETALVITANGTYVAPAGTVYTSIVVNVPTSSGGTPEGGEGETPHVHKYTSEVIEPSCMQVGYTLYTCECGHSYKSDEKAPLDHDYIDGTCSRCGAADPTYTPDVSEPAKGSYSVNVGDTFRISYEGNSPDVECPGCLTFYIDSNELIFTAVSAGSGTIYIRISDTLIGEYTVTVAAVSTYDYSLKVGETFSISYEGSSPSVECPSCLTYYIDGGELVFTAANVGSGTLWLHVSDTLIAKYTIQVTAQESGGDAHVHSYMVVVTKPTCTAEGYTTHTCQCGLTFNDTPVEPLGHDWGEPYYSSEFSSGYGHKCQRLGCGELEELDPPVHEHTWVATENVGFSSGYGYVCSGCGELGDELDRPTCDHDWLEDDTVEPTCTEEGYTNYYCTCGETKKDDYVAAIGHTWSGWTTTLKATCDEDGSEKRTCSECGKTETNTIDALGHRNTTYYPREEPTCTVDGHTQYTVCNDCGKVIGGSNTILPAKHTPKTLSGYAATCTAPGKTDGVACSVCGEILTAQTTIPANGHSYTSKVTPATCTEGGYTTYTCSKCGHSYRSDETDPNGHDFRTGWVTAIAATCTSSGTEERSCLTCGHKDERKTNPLGHDWEYYPDPTVSSGTSRVCRRCELVEEDV